MTKIIAFANQKGGVGKTSSLLGIASAASSAGKRVLVVDFDPQGNATSCLGVDASEVEYTTNDVIYADEEGAAEVAIVPTEWENVDLIATNLELEARETDLEPDAIFRLKVALEFEGIKKYDLVLIDCQPSVGRLVYSALIAADSLIVVTEPSVNATQGVSNVFDTVEKVRRRLNPELTLDGVIINKVPHHTRESRYRLEELESALGDQIMQPHIPFRALVAESQGAQKSLHSYGYKSADVSVIFDQYLKQLLEGVDSEAVAS